MERYVDVIHVATTATNRGVAEVPWNEIREDEDVLAGSSSSISAS